MLVVDPAKLEDGDIILTNEGLRPISLLIRLVTLSRFSHASIYLDGHVYDSTGDGVFDDDAIRLVRYPRSRIRVLRPRQPPTVAQLDAMRSFLGDSIGQSYTVAAALQVGIRKFLSAKLHRTADEFCSRFVAQTYRKAGILLVHNPDFCSPQAFVRNRRKLLFEPSNCYRHKTALDSAIVAIPNATLANRRHLKQWLDHVKMLAKREHEVVASESDVLDFVVRHPQYDHEIAEHMRSSGYLADYKVFFARYWFKLSAATFHPYIGGPHFETMATLELADIANGDKWIANLADCEHNYRLCPLEVLREQRNLYFKLTVIAIRRLQVLKDLCLKEGFSPSSPLAIGIAGLLTPTLALARSTTATLSVFTARELHRLHLLGKIMV